MAASSSGKYALLDQLADEFAARCRRGERPSLQEYVDHYPDLAHEIRELFPAMVDMEQVKQERREAEASLATDTSAPLERIGDFRIIREIGHGGMGVVYEAEQQALGRRVAVKVLPPHALRDPDKLRRFEREARSAARLHHTNIVPVFGVGCQDGTHYYVMQFIQGLGVDEVLAELKRLRQAQRSPATMSGDAARSGADASAVSAVAVAQALLTGQFSAPAADSDASPARAVKPGARTEPGQEEPRQEEVPSSVVLPGATGSSSLSESGRSYWQSVARVGIQVAEALAYAHGQGILHRDIKPSNLLLDLHGTVWVTDFGLAKAATDEGDLTHTGDIVGTIRYMAPERFEGQADPRSDLYSLGLTLYEFLVPQPAFTETNRNKLVHQVLHQEPVAPRQLNPDIPRDLETVVLKAMARDPQHRYATAAELAADLQRFVEDRPIRARRVGLLERFWRWCRRNPVLAGMAAVIVLVTALGLAGVFWQWRQAEQARDIATARAEAEAEARQTSERTLVDMYTSSGLMASERNDPAQAVLWFANAVRRAGDDHERQLYNRVRAVSWQRQALQPLRALEHQAEWVHEMSWHPGGRYLRTQTVLKDLSDGDATVWDLDQEAPWPLPAGVASARSAAWNPDGSRLALGTATGEVVLCRFPTSEVLHRLPVTGHACHLAFSPEGRFLAIASDTSVGRSLGSFRPYQRVGISFASQNFLTPSLPGTVFSLLVGHCHFVRVWDCETVAFVTEELVHPDRVATLSFHPKGHLLVTTCFDQRARVFRVARDTKALLFPPVPHHVVRPDPTGAKSNPPVFVDEGRGLLTTGGGKVTWYDAETGAPQLLNPSEPSRLGVGQVEASPDGKYFVTTGWNVSPQIWDVASRRPVSPVLDHKMPVLSLSFSPDGRTLVTGCGDRAVRRWSVPDGKLLGGPLVHPSTVTQALFSPDGRFLATAQRGGLTRVWALPVPDARHRRLPVEATAGSLARLSGDGRYVLPTGMSFRAGDLRATRAFEVATGQPAGPRLESGGFILHGAFSPDGRQAALVVSLAPTRNARASASQGTHPGQLQLWDWRTGQRLFDPLALPSEPRFVDYRPDGQTLAVICAGGQLVLVDPGSGRVQGQWQARPPALSTGWYGTGNGAVRISPDSRSVLIFGTENVVRVLDIATGLPRYEPLRHQDRCVDVCFSPDGRLVSIASWDGSVRVWELETGQPVSEPLPHPDWVHGATFSPDGNYLLTACRDSTARLWDWRAGREVCPAFQHDNEVFAVAFTPDGRWVLTASHDNTMRVWESVTGKPVTLPLELGGRGLSLSVTPDGKHAVVGGFIRNELAVFDLGDLEGDTGLDADDLVVWAELLSGQRIHEGAGVTNLTAEEWLERWRGFRLRHAMHARPEPGK